MSFNDAIKKSVLAGFTAGDISTTRIFVTLGITFLIAVYIFFAYRLITSNTFYDKGFNVSMAIISVVTAGIILAMQSSIVISLGMVGALSIVRFRTAIKEPMDLLFLFWSIGTGIICGAGLYELAIIVAVIVTVGILILQIIPSTMSPYVLVINARDKSAEEEIMSVVKQYTKGFRIDSKNITNAGMDLILEVRTRQGSELVDKVSSIEGVSSANLLYHDGVVKG